VAHVARTVRTVVLSPKKIDHKNMATATLFPGVPGGKVRLRSCAYQIH
jgi:hypothetical protein